MGLALITLWILSVIVFAAGQLLPGDPGRAILGPLAEQRAVTTLDHQLGVDKPLVTQYWNWLTGILHGDLGTSYTYQQPIRPFITTALWNSLKLAAVAFLMCVPLAILAGVVAALNVGRLEGPLDLRRRPLRAGPARVRLRRLPGDHLRDLAERAAARRDAAAGRQPGHRVYHLILPAIPLTLVLFGYIMRMARAGTVAALEADYTRTAVLKGLPRRRWSAGTCCATRCCRRSP